MSNEGSKRIVRAAQAWGEKAATFRHPLNPDSEISGARLGAIAGLERIAVNIARIPPGKESFIYHRHFAEEEWIYVLEGRGQAETDGELDEVGPGDFVGYPRGVAHTLRNVGDVDLVYLMGGMHSDLEIVAFPHLKKRMLRVGRVVEIVDEAAIAAFPVGATDG
jgi:uncharacterized cupin superfamily protein